MAREVAYIGFGSNVGDRRDFCDRAVTLLSLVPGSQVTGVSSLYETEPVCSEIDPGASWFLNGVVRLETEVRPRKLLEVCREIERSLGRDLEPRGGPRTLDLDLLFYGSRVIQEPGLVVPHPRLHERRFVLEPLAELASDLQHPFLGRSVGELLAHLADSHQVRRLPYQAGSRYGLRPGCAKSAASVGNGTDPGPGGPA